MSKDRQVIFQCNYEYPDGSFCFYKATHELEWGDKHACACGFHKDKIAEGPYKFRPIGNAKWVEIK